MMPNLTPVGGTCGSVEEEFQAALSGTAVTDSSAFGRIEVRGKDRLDLLHRLSTNAIAGLAPGDASSTVFVTDKGRVIDRVNVCARRDSLILITSPGRELFLIRWIDKYTLTEDIRFRIITDETVMGSLIGARMISSFLEALEPRPRSSDAHDDGPGEAGFVFARRGDSSRPLADVIASQEGAHDLAALLGALPGARWIGGRAYEGFRIASGIPGSPGELNESYNPLECGLRGSVSFTKGCYIGQEVIARLDTYGKIRRRLVRVACAEPWTAPLPVSLTKEGAEAGALTSMAGVLSGGQFPGLAIVRSDLANPGDRLDTGPSSPGVLVTGIISGS
jgi:hypothetical protein